MYHSFLFILSVCCLYLHNGEVCHSSVIVFGQFSNGVGNNLSISSYFLVFQDDFLSFELLKQGLLFWGFVIIFFFVIRDSNGTQLRAWRALLWVLRLFWFIQVLLFKQVMGHSRWPGVHYYGYLVYFGSFRFITGDDICDFKDWYCVIICRFTSRNWEEPIFVLPLANSKSRMAVVGFCYLERHPLP